MWNQSFSWLVAHLPWWRITAYADVGVLLPAALVIALWLWVGRTPKLGFWWLFWFGGGMSVVVASKLAFLGWGIGIQSWDFAGFSGHAMRAAAVYPVALLLICRRGSPRLQMCGFMLGLAWAGLIAWSRVVVGAHSWSEAVTGAMLGVFCALGFLWHLRQENRLQIPNWLIILSLAALAATPGAGAAPTQSWLIGVAMKISGHDRPFLRECWCFPPQPWIAPKGSGEWRQHR